MSDEADFFLKLKSNGFRECLCAFVHGLDLTLIDDFYFVLLLCAVLSVFYSSILLGFYAVNIQHAWCLF